MRKKSPSDSKLLPMDDEDDENDDDGESGRDLTKIEACLLYTSNLTLPNNRKFCDVTFSHGQGVGALLCNDTNDDVTNDDVIGSVTNDVTGDVTSSDMDHTSASEQDKVSNESVPEFSVENYLSICTKH